MSILGLRSQKAECTVPTEVIRLLRSPADQKTNTFFEDLTEAIYSQNSFKWKLFTTEVSWKTVQL